MKISEQGIELIIKHESCASRVKGVNFFTKEYPKTSNGGIDWSAILCYPIHIISNAIVYPYICEGGYNTVGFGTRIDNDKGILLYKSNFENGINIADCKELLYHNLTIFEQRLNQCLNDNGIEYLSQNQFDALCVLCYNRPIWAEKIIKQQGILENMWLKFNTVGGEFNSGLYNRRKEELELFKKC